MFNFMLMKVVVIWVLNRVWGLLGSKGVRVFRFLLVLCIMVIVLL